MVNDVSAQLSMRAPLAPPVRVGLFLVALAVVTGAGWVTGRVANPPIAVPDLPAPSVFVEGPHGANAPHGVGGRPAEAR